MIITKTYKKFNKRRTNCPVFTGLTIFLVTYLANNTLSVNNYY